MLTTPSLNSFTVQYPQANVFTKTAMQVFWLPDEVSVEKDVQDLRVNLTEAERHGVLTVLKLFTMYEQKVGAEFWMGKIINWFPRHEIQEMASYFGMTELAIHKRFYKRLNEELGLDNDEFYNAYLDDSDLTSRMDFISDILDGDDKLLSLAVFSILEGAVLYSSFAFLKHFQAKGKNKLQNVCAGIDFSVRDENIHSEAGAWLYRTYLEENPTSGWMINNSVLEAARKIYEHEKAIIAKIFERGTIEGVTATQLEHFVEHRINVCLQGLGMQSMFDVNYNPIGDWFYKNINGYKSVDFFARQGKEYSRNWNEKRFTW